MKKQKKETKAQRVDRLLDEAIEQASELRPAQRVAVWRQLAHRSVGRLTTEALEGQD